MELLGIKHMSTFPITGNIKPRWKESEFSILLNSLQHDETLQEIQAKLNRSSAAIKTMTNRKFSMGYKTENNETKFLIKKPYKRSLVKSKVFFYRIVYRALSSIQGAV